MSTDKNNEPGAQDTGGQGPAGSPQPGTGGAEDEVRIGTKQDARVAGAQGREDTSEPRDNLRDGT